MEINYRESKGMNKYKKLVGNSLIFGIGNFSSKLLLILLVPFYTFYLSTSEYGTVDIITTTTNMLVPLISLSIYESVLRFVMDNKSIQSVVTNSIAITGIGIFISVVAYPILSYFNILDGLLVFFYMILISQALQSIIAQYTRAIGKIKVYAINGIIRTLTLGISNVLLLIVFKQGINGYLISITVSNIVSIFFFILNTNFLKNIKIGKLDVNLAKDMLKYSIPLIPNSFMWWIMNTSNRYFILFYKGVEVNGLFAVAYKIPTIITMFTTIFSQAWQLSAIEEYNSEEKSKFYSKIFNYYQSFLFLGVSAILVIIKPLMDFAFAEEYYPSWQYIPFLLLSVLFSSFSGFLGTSYIAAKKTKGVFKTSIIGGILGVILNFIFVPILGGVGAGIATMISFFVIWILRLFDTKKYIYITINIRHLILSLFIIFTQITILFLDINNLLELCFLFLCFLFLLKFSYKMILKIISIGVNKLINRFKVR